MHFNPLAPALWHAHAEDLQRLVLIEPLCGRLVLQGHQAGRQPTQHSGDADVMDQLGPRQTKTGRQ
jgi:hypothetical protein